MSIFLRFHLSPIPLLTYEKHKTDPLRSVSLLAPRHPSAHLRMADQRPLFYTNRIRYSIVGLECTPTISVCQ